MSDLELSAWRREVLRRIKCRCLPREQIDGPIAFYKRGRLQEALGRREKAIASFAEAVRIDPGLAEAKSRKIHRQAHICDWAALEAEGSVSDASLAALGTGAAAVPHQPIEVNDDSIRHGFVSESHRPSPRGSAQSRSAALGRSAAGSAFRHGSDRL